MTTYDEVAAAKARMAAAPYLDHRDRTEASAPSRQFGVRDGAESDVE